jgi:hypothetical protein
MAKIVINIDMDELKSGINQVVDDDMYEAEEEFVCPLSTQDADLNDKNREHAIQEYAYGHSVKNWEKKKQICGTCEYYNIRSSMLDCIESGIGMNEGDEVGYCTKLDFTCMAENVCNAWEKGGPMTDFDDIDEMEPLEGGSKDIF